MKENFNQGIFSQLTHNWQEDTSFKVSHQERCDRLISSGCSFGWESQFASALRSCKAIAGSQAEKLAEIEAKFQQDSL